MAVELAEAYISLVPSLKGAQGAIAREMGVLSDEANTATGRGFSGGLKGALAVGAIAAIGVGISKAVAGAVELGLSSIDAASSLQQSTGAVEAIFGPASDAVKQFGKDSANVVGLSRNSYQELASVLGAQLKNGGTSIDELGGKTDKLITLGADLSAQFGGDAKSAVEALSSALRGERDPIERYGVSLTQAAIDAKAAELGFSKVNGSLSTQATQAATLALIYDQTAAAQGTFATESDTLAGKQQRLAAAFENSKAKLGEALLPAATAFVGFVTERLVPVFDKIVTAITPVLDTLGPQLSAVFATIDTDAIAAAFQQAAEASIQLLPALIGLIPSIISLLPLIIQLAVAVLPLLPPLISALIIGVQIITEGIRLWTESTKGLFDGLGLLFGMLTGTVAIDDFVAGVRDIPGPLGTVLTAVTDAGTAFGNFFHGIGVGIVSFVTGVRTGVGQVIGFFQALPGNIAGIIGGIANTLITAGRDLIDGFIRGIRGGFDKVKQTLGSLTALLPSWKGPQSLDKVILKESGQLVINGFINGLESRYGAVQSSLGALTTSLAPTSIQAGRGYLDSSTVASSGAGDFVNRGTIITQDVASFFEQMRKDQRRAQALEGLNEVVIA
jgi:hypothetical protein